MEDSYVTEFRKLQADVLDSLRAREFLPPNSSGLSGFQLLIDESLGQAECWDSYIDLAASSGLDTAVLICSRWRRDLDADKFRNPVERLRHGTHIKPTIEIEHFRIPRATYDSIWNVLRELPPLSPNPTIPIGLDGTSYEFAWWDSESPNGPSRRYTWWEEIPPEWAILRTTLDRVFEMIQDCTTRR